ncbi:hypothetical protein BDZ45DRAFT_105080 [Acephala macrosclerotiorum]|nr:hypothetical protein BDZ45DRAFT_105080 [Acephala macrosclerotiorum]
MLPTIPFAMAVGQKVFRPPLQSHSLLILHALPTLSKPWWEWAWDPRVCLQATLIGNRALVRSISYKRIELVGIFPSRFSNASTDITYSKHDSHLVLARQNRLP